MFLRSNAVQLFDSWANALSWNDYHTFSHKYNKYILANLKRTVPVISFAKGASVFAPVMAESNPDVISVDWNADLLNIKKSLPAGMAVQGNLIFLKHLIKLIMVKTEGISFNIVSEHCQEILR